MIPSLFDESIKTTVSDCIDKAEFPERITFGLSIQGLDNIDFSDIKNEKRIIYLDKNIAYGTGKTRYHLQQMYSGEEYILSIDCHTGFKNGWDTWLIEKYKELDNEKAVITQFLGDTFIDKCMVSQYKFTPSDPWIITYDPAPIKNKVIDKYIKTQRVSPHFIFGNKEIMKLKYPTQILFNLEEHILSMQYFCNGLDMYELEQTVLSTVPKSQRSCEDRDRWLAHAYNKHTHNKRRDLSLPSQIGKDARIKYIYDNLRLSYHLINKNTGMINELRPAVADLLEHGFSDILEQDYRSCERTIAEYFDFHNISQAQINQTIKFNRKDSI